VTVTYQAAEQALADRLSEPALRHCRAVAETAAALAAIYGVDVERAQLAGLLHDWHRELEHDALVSSAQEAGIVVEAVDLRVPYLLHARTGAAALGEEFDGLDDEVLTAIERHTVGSPEMTDLDMVVYVADMIEPGRSFPGVNDVRECVGTVSLRDLFAQAYAHSLAHLVRSRKQIHPMTVAVWNSLVAKDRS
jgi:predicted HD superfamily hydrolase involved in NAD metabolism